MKQEILKYLLGNLSLGFILSFYIFALLGVILSMLLHYKKKDNKRKVANSRKPFKLRFWIEDNGIRFLTSIICIFIVVRFYDELPIQYELNMFLGLLVGASLDRVIIFIRNKTKVTLFQSSKNNN